MKILVREWCVVTTFLTFILALGTPTPSQARDCETMFSPFLPTSDGGTTIAERTSRSGSSLVMYDDTNRPLYEADDVFSFKRTVVIPQKLETYSVLRRSHTEFAPVLDLVTVRDGRSLVQSYQLPHYFLRFKIFDYDFENSIQLMVTFEQKFKILKGNILVINFATRRLQNISFHTYRPFTPKVMRLDDGNHYVVYDTYVTDTGLEDGAYRTIHHVAKID